MFSGQWFQLDSSSYFCYRTLAFPCAFCKTDDLHTALRSLSHRTYAVSMSWSLQWPLTCCSTGRWLVAETFLKCPHEENTPPSTQQIPHSHAAGACVRQRRQEGSLYRFPVVAYFTYTLKGSRDKGTGRRSRTIYWYKGAEPTTTATTNLKVWAGKGLQWPKGKHKGKQAGV